MAQILPRDLTAIPGGIINPAAAIIIDNEDGVFKGTPANVVDAGAPVNTQPEAEAGVINTGRMSPLRVSQAIAALGVSQAVLAAPTGGEMVGFEQTGTGSQPRDINAKALEEVASIEDFAGDPEIALLAAATAHTEVKLGRNGTYALADMVDLSALQKRRIYLNGATISAAGGFTDKHLLSVSGNSKIIGPGIIDGTNIPAPTGAYASGDYEGVGIFITGTGNGGAIEDIEFTTFQSGPILHDSATTREGYAVRNCSFSNVQIYTANATNAVVALHGVSRSVMEDCRLVTYNWKGFYFANGRYNVMSRCHSTGGVDGHASHYITGGSDNWIVDCSHTGVVGVGFGIKCSDTTRPCVIGFKTQDARSACMFQGCEDFIAIGIEAWRPTIAPLFIEGSSTYGAATRGIVIGLRSRRAAVGASGTDRGIYITGATKLSRTVSAATQANPCQITTSAPHGFKEGERVSFSGVGGMTQLNGNTYFVRNPTSTTFELYTATGPLNSTGFGAFTSGGTAACGGEVDSVTVRDSYLENFLYGIHVNNSGFQQTNIRLIDNELVNCGQYGILAYIGSGEIRGNRISMDGAAVEAAVHVERDAVTTTGSLVIENNEFSGCTADNIELLTRLHYASIRVKNNRHIGGTIFLNFNGNGNSLDTVGLLEVSGNQGVGLTTGCSLTFNTSTSTRVKIESNNFVNGSYVPVADSLTNLTNVTSLGTSQRGTATLAAGTVAVSLPIAEPNASYRISLSGNAAETFSWASKAAGGFTINSSNAGSTASVDWVVSR